MAAGMRGAVALLLGLAFVAALSLPDLTATTVLAISNGGQLAAVLVATAACGLAAWRTGASERRTWVLLAAATGSWAGGQVVWSYYEVIAGTEVPFPSVADVGYLLFPVLATPALLFWQGTTRRASARGRDLLDGAIIAASLLVLSWSTTLGTVVAEGGASWLAATLSLSYPLGDIILATVVFSILGRVGSGRRTALLLVAAGVGGLAVADSAYVFLVATGSYSSGDLVSSGWVFGFLLIAAGAFTANARARVGSGQHSEQARQRTDRTEVPAAATRLRMLLPYPPLLAAGTTTCYQLATSTSTPGFDLSLGVVLVILVLARQFLAMQENSWLLHKLELTRDQLLHETLHDPLTGLANRALFADRLEHALAQRKVSVSLLYCDLDDFKSINDGLGHGAGDGLLRIVAERLVGCVRPADTVARLGGDEFAVLLEESAGDDVAERIVASVREPFDLGLHTVCTTISVGVAHHRALWESAARNHLRSLPEAVSTTAEHLLSSADSAMYEAKASGKGQVVHAEPLTPTAVVSQ